jgi:hypothetical protein
VALLNEGREVSVCYERISIHSSPCDVVQQQLDLYKALRVACWDSSCQNEIELFCACGMCCFHTAELVFARVVLATLRWISSIRSLTLCFVRAATVTATGC